MGLPKTRHRACALPIDMVLLKHSDVAYGESRLGPAARELVQRGDLLGDDRGVLDDHVGDVGGEPNIVRPGSRDGEDLPHILVVRFVGAVAGVEPQLIYQLDYLEQRPARLLQKPFAAALQSRLSSGGMRSRRPSDSS